MGLFQEEEQGIGIASEIVVVQGKDLSGPPRLLGARCWRGFQISPDTAAHDPLSAATQSDFVPKNESRRGDARPQGKQRPTIIFQQ